MRFYLRGESLIEAYWKSVAWPGEGLFIGEPLAAPWSPHYVAFEGSTVDVSSNLLRPGLYALQKANDPVGPYRDTGKTLRIVGMGGKQRLAGLDDYYCRLQRRETAETRKQE